MKEHIEILNQLFSLEQKLKKENQIETYARYINRIMNSYKELEYDVHNPLNEKYNESRSDVQANITGQLGNNLIITQVIKPIIFLHNQVVQQGIVIVENK
jgi:hypothetical protein